MSNPQAQFTDTEIEVATEKLTASIKIGMTRALATLEASGVRPFDAPEKLVEAISPAAIEHLTVAYVLFKALAVDPNATIQAMASGTALIEHVTRVEGVKRIKEMLGPEGFEKLHTALKARSISSGPVPEKVAGNA